jgi:hypothetical protein
VFYTNDGKGPALNIKSNINPIVAPNTDPVIAGVNHTCDSISPDDTGPDAFPAPLKQPWKNGIIPRKSIPDTVWLNSNALVLHGCFAYKTMDEIHRTWFCYVVYQNGRLANSPIDTLLCEDGHGAN